MLLELLFEAICIACQWRKQHKPHTSTCAYYMLLMLLNDNTHMCYCYLSLPNWIIIHRNIFCVAWYWNLRIRMRFFWVLTGALQHYVSHARMLSTENVSGTFFNIAPSSKSNCNRNFPGQSSGWNLLIVVMCTFTYYYVLSSKAVK